MKKTSELYDFYRQLGLLLKADIPMPTGLRQLASSLGSGGFKETVEQMALQTSKGVALSSAMRNFPHYFPQFHRNMVQGGECHETLPDVLFELARLAHIEKCILSLIKSIAAYPLFVILLALGLFLFIYTFIVPEFSLMFDEMMGEFYVELPAATAWSIAASRFCVTYFLPLLAFYVILVGGIGWLLISRSQASARIGLWATKCLPFSGAIFRHLTIARLCSLWSVLVRQQVPTRQSFETMAGLVNKKNISQALQRVAEKDDQGQNLVESLQSEPELPNLLALTVDHTPENELTNELSGLADYYKDRVNGAIREASVAWEIGLIVVMVFLVGSFVISLFMPLISIMDMLGGM